MTFDLAPANSSFRIRLSENPPGNEVVCPFPFAVVSGDQAEEALALASKRLPNTSPVILGEPETAAERLRQVRPRHDASAILREATQVDLEQWKRTRRVDFWENKPPDTLLSGDWPEHLGPRHDLLSPWRRERRGDNPPLPHRRVIIAMLPVADPVEAIAALDFGAWNNCPEPAIHLAFARMWQRQYGLRLVVCAGDFLEFRVARPVGNRDDALRLAEEQYYYCPDIVEQGTGTIEALAARLLGGTCWFFWWD
jgi:hypothetical protein